MAEGILSRFMSRPGQAEALMNMGAQLMAGGAPSYDPGASARAWGTAGTGYTGALADARRAQEAEELRKMQLDKAKAEAEKERRAQEGRDALSRTLLGSYMSGQGPAAGSPRAAQEAGMTDPGALAAFQGTQGALLRGIAAADPGLAAKQALALSTPKSEEYTLTPGAARYKGGKMIAERLKDEDPKYSGEVFLDKNVGKYYQIHPKTLKREYISPNEEFAIEGDGKGGFSIRKGPAGEGGGLTKSTTTDIQGKLVNAKEGLVRLKGVSEKFRPEYQQVATRWDALVTSWKSKLGGPVDPKDEALLQDFSAYKQEATANMNQYIKDMTGAAMGEAEATRLRKAIPDPGDGIADGDDPISFKAKMDNAIALAEKAQVRYAYYLKNGITNVYEMAAKTPLDDIQIAVNPKTGARIANVGGEWVPM